METKLYKLTATLDQRRCNRTKWAWSEAGLLSCIIVHIESSDGASFSTKLLPPVPCHPGKESVEDRFCEERSRDRWHGKNAAAAPAHTASCALSAYFIPTTFVDQSYQHSVMGALFSRMFIRVFGTMEGRQRGT